MKIPSHWRHRPLVHWALGFAAAISPSVAAEDGIVVYGALRGGPASPTIGEIVSVVAGPRHALGLKSDGTVVGWGWNGVPPTLGGPCGQCDPPDGLGLQSAVVRLAAGVRHSMALLADGSVVCWGCDEIACDVPEALRTAPTDPAVDIAAGSGHSIALLASGTIVCWGSITNEGVDPCLVPVEAQNPRNPPVQVLAVGDSSMAVLADGSLVDWGAGLSLPAPAVVGGASVVAAAVLHDPLDGQTVPGITTLLDDGRVVNGPDAWTFDSLNPCVDVVSGIVPVARLADGTLQELREQHRFAFPGFGGAAPTRVADAAGGIEYLITIPVATDCDDNGVPDHVQITKDPTADCSGNGVLDICERRRAFEATGAIALEGTEFDLNDEGDLEIDAIFSVEATGDLSAASEHLVVTFAGQPIATLFADTTVRDDCVARQASFTIPAALWNASSGLRVLVVTPSEAVDPAICSESTITIQADLGVVLDDCDGNGISDACDVAGGAVDLDGDLIPDVCQPDCDGDGVPDSWQVFLDPSLDGCTLDGRLVTCLPEIPGGVVCVTDIFGPVSLAIPPALIDPVSPVAKLEVGFEHAVALHRDGSVTCWGSNQSGQLDVPPGIGVGEQVVIDVVTGPAHIAAILVDGSVVCWGLNIEGQCDVPSGIGSPGREAVAVACGAGHSMALLADGSVVCWGMNYEGQLDVPSDIGPGGLRAVRIAAAEQRSLAVLEDGTLACWGEFCSVVADYSPDESNPIVDIGVAYGCVALLMQDGTVRGFGGCSDDGAWKSGSSLGFTPPVTPGDPIVEMEIADGLTVLRSACGRIHVSAASFSVWSDDFAQSLSRVQSLAEFGVPAWPWGFEGPVLIGVYEDEPWTDCLGDLTGDGQVGSVDLGTMLAFWGPCVGCNADLDGDGVVRASDLGMLLGAWGDCP